MASDDRVPPVGAPSASEAPAPPPQLVGTVTYPRATEFLQDNHKIGIVRTHYLKYRRYLELKSNQLFATLVSLYEVIFKQLWHKFRRMTEPFIPMSSMSSQTSIRPWRTLAINYISSWFVDLYVSNREAAMKISSLAFNQHYHHELVHNTTFYDDFLVALNAAIRPTHLQLIPEDVLYIPLLTQDKPIDWSSSNPFHIKDFHFDFDLFHGIQDVMRSDKTWKLSPLTTNTLGRPSWLFDWHDGDDVCAFFPPDSNFNADDMTVAYILGVACTPNLGPYDLDDWQFFTSGVVPANPRPADYPLIRPRHSFGSYEVTTMIIDADHTESLYTTRADEDAQREAKRKKTLALAITSGTSEPSRDPDPGYTTTSVAAPRFRLLNWFYYCQVFKGTDVHTRTGAHRMICLHQF